MTMECVNCHLKHEATFKACPVWLEAMAKAHRSYSFPAQEQSASQTRNAAKDPATVALPSVVLPLLEDRKQKKSPKKRLARDLLDEPADTPLGSSILPQTSVKHIQQPVTLPSNIIHQAPLPLFPKPLTPSGRL